MTVETQSLDRPQRVIVLAAEYREAERWADLNRVIVDNWMYLNQPSDLMGFTGILVILAGWTQTRSDKIAGALFDAFERGLGENRIEVFPTVDDSDDFSKQYPQLVK